jgi:hypothetical protein
MMEPSTEQVLGALRVILTAILTAGLSYAAQHDLISQGEVAMLAGALCTIGIAFWSWVANSLSRRTEAVSNSGVTVLVPHSAPASLRKLAADPEVPNVLPER